MNFDALKEDLKTRGMADDDGIVCIPRINEKFLFIEYNKDGLPVIIDIPRKCIYIYERHRGGGLTSMMSMGRFEPLPPKTEDEKQTQIEELEIKLAISENKQRVTKSTLVGTAVIALTFICLFVAAAHGTSLL